MKTQIYLTALLALTIQVMVNGQTQGNPAGDRRARILPTLGAVKPTNTIKAVTAAPQTSDSPQNNVYYNASSHTQLIKQAEELASDVKFLREEAAKKSGIEKDALLKQANIISKQAETNQIKASEIAGKTNREQFKINKENLNAILAIDNGGEYATKQAKELMFDAIQNFRLAQEMREEAYAMPTGASKLGTMINAEEKEGLAISQQNKAIELLKINNPQLAGNITAILNGNVLATK